MLDIFLIQIGLTVFVAYIDTEKKLGAFETDVKFDFYNNKRDGFADFNCRSEDSLNDKISLAKISFVDLRFSLNCRV